MSESPADPVLTLAGWMRGAQSVSVMTGAGASTESGVLEVCLYETAENRMGAIYAAG